MASEISNRTMSGISLSESLDEIESNVSVKSSEVPVRARKLGGWADENSRYSNEKHESMSRQVSDDIPEIPDMDDLDESPNLEDVKVPNVSVNKATYRDLDKNNKMENLKKDERNFGNLGDIDLSLLSSKLYPESEVANPDEIWRLDSLASELFNSN